MTDRPRRHGNRRAARLFIGLGLALMLAAGALLGYNLLQSYNAGRAATAAAAQLAELFARAETE